MDHSQVASIEVKGSLTYVKQSITQEIFPLET